MTSLSKEVGHFRRRIDTKDLLNRGRALVLFAILLGPSVWMLSAIPPLWRDVDAYVQLTRPPGFETILRYGPLYCFLARIPLYFGFAIDCLKASASLPKASFFVHPILTDSGVLALLVSQHLALGLATLHFIAATTRMFWVRLILVAVWAANPLFYTFAHCIGTETFSMILTLLIGAIGLRIVRHSRRVPKKEWFVFAVLLWLSILTRHINAALIGLLPLTLLLLAGYRVTRIRFARRQLLRRWHWLRAMQTLQKAMFAVVTGICCILLANGASRAICYAVQTPYHSALGVTFLFRLKFLAGLSVQERNQLLENVSRNSDSPDVKNVISLLQRELPAGASNLDVGAFTKELEASLAQSQIGSARDTVDAALSHTAWAFLYPPSQLFLRAVRQDFNRSQEIAIPDVVRFLFVTTTFYFSHSASMPQFASLITFRGKNADQIFAIFKGRSYFHHPKNLSFCTLLFFWTDKRRCICWHRENLEASGCRCRFVCYCINSDRITDDGCKLLRYRLPTTFYSSDVGTDDYVADHPICRNHGCSILPITRSAIPQISSTTKTFRSRQIVML